MEEFPNTITPEGKTFTVLPFNKIRKYGGKYVLTQTNTISNDKFEEYTSPHYVPETLLDYYYYRRINEPELELPIPISLDVCKTVVRSLTVRLEGRIRDVSTSLFVQKQSYDSAVESTVNEIKASIEVFTIDKDVVDLLYKAYDTDTVGDNLTSGRAFAVDMRRARDILDNLAQRSASELKIYSGGPGCGKTYKCIEDIHLAGYKKVLVTSLSNIVGLRFLARLDIKGSEQWSFSKVAFSRFEKIQLFDAIVVEEASMISSSEFLAILKLVNTGLPIFFLGDPYQLPGFTGLGNMFATLLTDFRSNVTYLTQQHRMNLELCEMIERTKATGILPHSNLTMRDAVGEFVEWIEKNEDAVAITYRNKDCLMLNDIVLGSCFGFESEYKASKSDSQGKDVDMSSWEAVLNEAMAKNVSLRVISISNISKSIGGKFTRILSNGEQGTIEYELGMFVFTSKENNLTQTFTMRDMLMNFRLGYAMTIHKAQGSEWSKVFYMEPKQDFTMRYSLNHRYVAMTRAKDKLIWCDKNSRSIKNTFLTFNNIITNTRI